MPGSTGTPPTTPPTTEHTPGESPLDVPDYFVNRERSRLAHIAQNLAAAEDEHSPLFERLKLLALTSSNIDQFFVTRIGELKRRVGASFLESRGDRRSLRQIRECCEAVRAIERRQRALLDAVVGDLADSGIRIVNFENLDPRSQRILRDRFFENVYPLVTPQVSDSAHPFPALSNLSLNLLVSIRESPDAPLSLARVKVPVGAGIPRFMQLRGPRRFVPLESVITANLELLFPGGIARDSSLFRVTCIAPAEHDGRAAGGRSNGAAGRRFAPIVRLEVSSDMPSGHRSLLADEFGLDQSTDVFEVPGLHALSDLLEIVDSTEADTPMMRRIERVSRLVGASNPIVRRRARDSNPTGSR
jgi:polyphosphate kinase